MDVRSKRRVAVLVALAVAWTAFFYSGRALLVWQWTDADENTLSCYYLAANDAFEREHLYTASGWIGRTACPRLIRLDR